MLNLSKSERQVILFLFGCAILGLGLAFIKNYIPREDVSINSAKIDLSTREPVINKKVNINTDSSYELCELPQIGPALAKRIIEHKNRYGPYRRTEDIRSVKGIGDSKYNIIREFISVE
jgi:competence protein ComEA